MNKHRSFRLVLVSVVAPGVLSLQAGCTGGEYGASGPDPDRLGRTWRGLNGVPEDGYPNYEERLQLVAINRVRADPNNPQAGTADPCSENKDPQPPVLYDHDAGQAARFHCAHLMLNQGGLSHATYCELREDIEANGCDGSAGCSCVSGTECWSCDTLGGCGTNYQGRMTRFGFVGSPAGEVGAAGYGDSWQAVQGWVTENPCDSATLAHRNTVTSGNANVVGTGYFSGSGCWSVYYFSDFGRIDGLERPRIASGIHRPESGSANSTYTFYANYHDPAGDPQSMHVVIDGRCQPMTVELGGGGNATYTFSGTMASAGCHAYYFLAYDASSNRATYPEIGSYRISVGEPCTDGEYTTEQAPADCEDLPCGDGTCEETAGENCSSCPDDCGRCDCVGEDCGGSETSGCGCRWPGWPDRSVPSAFVLLLALFLWMLRRTP